MEQPNGIVRDVLFPVVGEDTLKDINDLYNNTSIILTSNKAPSDWGELMGDTSITTAILDRIIH